MFEAHDAKKYCVGCGVALQPPIPLRTMDQERWFCIPRMGVLETLDDKKGRVV